MYLSRIMLDTKKRKTMYALNSPSIIHGMVEKSFCGVRQRNLWRLDNLAGELYLIVLSVNKPDFNELINQIGYDGSSAETKAYDRLVDSVEKNESYRFRLVANPTVSSSKNSVRERGKVYAHVTEGFQRKWLLDRSEKNGFHLDDNSFEITQNKWFSFFKKQNDQNKKVKLLAVTYEGVLSVTEPLLFKNLLIHGIGREKAYGMGLLTIMHV